MIHANELRIGNYVLGESLECRVTSFDIYQISRGALFSDPIPITPSVLEKSGFKRSNEFDTWVLMQEGLYLSISLDSIWWWSIDDVGGNEGSYVREIKYLHQLQNLYFCLTGTELSINLL